MSHPLEHKIETLRLRLRRMLALYGVSWVVAAVVGSVIVVGLADYVFRFQDRGLRTICTVLVLGALGWTAYRLLYLPLVVRMRDVDLAQRVQRRFPQLEDRLISAVEFLHQSEDDMLAGSPSLRKAVISQATAEIEKLDFGDALDKRPPTRAAMTMTGVCLVAAILVVLDPFATGIALARLANPFGNTAWPQKNYLELVEPIERVARGQAFEVEVVDARDARLPRDVRIHYRLESADGVISHEVEHMLRVDDKTARARRDNVLRPFAYRVEGGDDNSMPWIEVEVLEPPEIQSLAIRLVPPKYTGWPPEQPDRHLRALVGTQMFVSGKSTKPLKAAALNLGNDQEMPAAVSDDGHSFTIPRPGEPAPVIEESGAYWFDLTDRLDLHGGFDSRWDIRAVTDAPPTVSIERPTGNLFVTAEAQVPLRVTAKDDLAVHTVDLVYSNSIDGSEGTPEALSLFAGLDQVEPQPGGGFTSGAELGDRRVVDYAWELSGLGLAPGNQVTFHATATDYQPAEGESEPRRLIVITKEELQDRIASRQELILSRLAEVLKKQRAARSQVEALQIRLGEIGHLEQLDVDHLQAAELSQRQVNRSLTSRDDGVPREILDLLADLQNNQVDSPDLSRRMQGILDEIDRLDREHLPVIGRELTAAIKAAQVGLEADPTPDHAAVDTALTEAGTNQDAVIASLESMLGELAQWDNYRRFYRDVSQLLRDQQDLTRRTKELGRRTLTKDLKDLTPGDRADLQILSGNQQQLARLLDRIQQEMETTSQQLRESDPLAADTVADALAEARRLAISGGMRSAGDNLGRNQIGQAVSRQAKVAEDLQEVLDVLANRRENELARLVKKLREAEEDLADLRRRQDDLTQRFDQAADDRQLKQLGQEQEELRQQTEQMARRLERLLADRAGRTARDAAEQMGQGGQAAQAGDAGGAGRHADEARKKLDEAEQQLAARRLQAQAELAMEQLARLEDALKHVHRRQQQVIGETTRYEGLRKHHGQLTRAQATGLEQLAREQSTVATETLNLGEKLIDAGAFHLALTGAAREMNRAAALLDRGRTGPETDQAERNALRRLDMLLEALKPEEPDDDQDNGGGGGAGAGGQQGAANAIQTLAELKLLRLMQQEINLRTEQLEQAVANAGNATEEQIQEYADLGREQGQLADLVLQLIRPEEEAPEDDPENLPELDFNNTNQRPRPLPHRARPGGKGFDNYRATISRSLSRSHSLASAAAAAEARECVVLTGGLSGQTRVPPGQARWGRLPDQPQAQELMP